MKFSDEGIIISAKKYGENSLIIKILSKNHGICNAFIKNAISSKSYSKYQIGNLIFFDLYAKNNDSLAYVKIENLQSFASKYILDFTKLNIINLFCLIISKNFMEQDPNQSLFSSFLSFLESLEQDQKSTLSNIIKFELKLLEIFGYGLDLSVCVVNGKNNNLYFISPKSGKAVSYEDGRKYQDKLFLLSNFFKNDLILNKDITIEDLLQSSDIVKFFMKKYGLLDMKSVSLRSKVISHF